MLSGLKVEKKGKKEGKEKKSAAKEAEKKSKKEKKKERRKDQKRRKQKKNKGKVAKVSESSAASDDSSSASDEAVDGASPPQSAAPPVAAGLGTAPGGGGLGAPPGGRDAWMTKGPAAGEDDFFSRLGSDKGKKEEKMKPNPDEQKISEREYNPYLRGEVSNQPAPQDSGFIPSHLKVGDGGSAWRKRALKRQQQQATTEAVGEAVAPAPPPTATDRRGGRDGGERRAGDRRGGEEGRSRSRSARRASPSPQARRPRPAAAEGAGGAAAEGEQSESVMRRMQRKYGGAAPEEEPPLGGSSSSSAPALKAAAKAEDPTVLGALAMEAMLAGDMARYQELNERLEKAQARNAEETAALLKDSNAHAAARIMAAADGDVAPDGSRVRVLEEIDASGRSKALRESVKTISVHTKGRNKRGNANAIPGKGAELSGFYEDDNVSLEDLLRRERIEGVQDYDSNLANHIAKKGSKFKMLDEDEDEAYALGWYEHSEKKMDAKRRDDKKQRQEIRDKQRIQVNLEHCTRCMESKRFGRKDAMISTAQHSYLCFDGMNQCILPGQVFIAPMEHVQAMTDLDETAATEIRNYQKCLVRYFESENPPRGVIFAETAVHRVSRDKALLGAGAHAAIVAYPVEYELLTEARAFWKKAFDEAECEFTTQHRKVIETDAKGVRAKVPKGFPYVHADFAMGGGYAHVVEDSSEFPRDFMQHTVAGMCELTILDRAYAGREDYRQAVADFKKRFCDGGFDWAKSLQS